MRVAPTTSTRLLTIMLILSTNWSILENPITNRRFENFTDFELPTELIEAAGLGSEFSPSTTLLHTQAGYSISWQRFTRSLRLRDFFYYNPPEQPNDAPNWARIPNPRFEPTDTVGLSEYCPEPPNPDKPSENLPRFEVSKGLRTYLHSVQQTFERRFKKTPQTRQNLSNAARHTLKWLRQPDCPVCLVSTDKNLQPVVDFKSRYVQLVTAELSETHQPAEDFLNNQPAFQEPAFTDDDGSDWSELHELGDRNERAVHQVLNYILNCNLKKSSQRYDNVDFRDCSKHIQVELKSSTRNSTDSNTTPITLTKMRYLQRSLQDGWTVYIAYAFRDRLFTYKMTGTEIRTFKQVWIRDEQQNPVLNLLIPVDILQPVLIQRFREAADAAKAAAAADATDPSSVHNRALAFTVTAMKNSILPLLAKYSKECPLWLKTFLESALTRHPTTFADYKVPGCYVLYKLHKLSTQEIFALRKDPTANCPTRMISANWCWVTQPFALYVAKQLRTMVVQLPEYTKDSDAINRLLTRATVPAGAILISLDVKRLYPSIILSVCLEIIERFLCRTGVAACTRDLLLTCLRLVLTLNFCQFNMRVFYQILGFATGVTCGAEAADIYLHELLREEFGKVSAYILTYKRFIDDGFMIWTGTRFRAEQFLHTLNSKFRYANFEITWTINDYSTVFLDLTIFKGAGWLHTSYLDTTTFAKHINAYLYIAFNSCVPTSVKKSFITAEIQRHLRRCSTAGNYYNELCKFYNRLRARGYPQQFLRPLFEHAPQHSHRSSFLFKTTGNNKTDEIPSVLALPFSEFADKYFKSVLSDRLAELPPHLATVRKIAAWYKVPKIKDLYPVPGKNHLADSQPANVLTTTAAFNGPGQVPNIGALQNSTAAVALALVF